jgi:hypothetical protein
VPEYFLDIARRCFAKDQVPAVHPLPAFVGSQVDRVTFLGHAVAIHKRATERDIGRGVATADEYLSAQAGGAEMQQNYAEWLLAHEGPNDRTAAAVQAAMDGGLSHAPVRLMQAETLLRDGHVREAEAIAAAIAAQKPAGHYVLLQLAALQLRLGDVAGARRSREIAFGITPLSKELRRKFERLLP